MSDMHDFLKEELHEISFFTLSDEIQEFKREKASIARTIRLKERTLRMRVVKAFPDFEYLTTSEMLRVLRRMPIHEIEKRVKERGQG
jgi:hypothetical protein